MEKNMQKIALPEVELFPLWWNENKKVYVHPRGWNKLDFSGLDWQAPYTDTSKDGEEFIRSKPDYYAVRTGNRYVVVDIDGKGCQETADSLLEFLKSVGMDCNTYTVKTKSYGYHLYFLSPSTYEVKTCAAWLRGGIDIRGYGGNVRGPDLSLSSWEEGKYAVVNDVEPIHCSINLPRRGVQGASSSNGVVAPIISLHEYRDTGVTIRAGIRDQVLLALSGKCVEYDLSDEECAVEFSLYKFQAIPNDEIQLGHLMEKVIRDRNKSGKDLQEALDRFLYVTSVQKVYDTVAETLVPPSLMAYHYPKTMITMAEGKPREVEIATVWARSPDRKIVKGMVFKPTEEEIVVHKGKLYANQYEPSLVESYGEPVTWEDPVFDDFRALLLNLCNGDEDTVHLLLSQRAKKLRDLTWTPRWGFVMISTHYRIGKDLQLKIFAPLYGRGCAFLKHAKVSELSNDRSRYLDRAMFTLVSEPNGLKGKNALNAVENLKELFSETEAAITQLYQGIPDLMPVYRIPEIHSNFVDTLEIAMNNKRFAPIYCTNPPLEVAVYERIGKAIDGDNPVFMQKLKRMLMDYPIDSRINTANAPGMKDSKVVEEASRGQKYLDVKELISDAPVLLLSDLQTIQSMALALCIHGGLLPREASKMVRDLIKDDSMIEQRRMRAVPIVEYDQSNIVSESSRVDLIPTSKRSMVTVYSIRDHYKYLSRPAKDLRESFFADN